MTKRSAVRLTVIREPDEGKPIVIDLADDVTGITIFIDEHARNAPAMLCGDCDAVLVAGDRTGNIRRHRPALSELRSIQRNSLAWNAVMDELREQSGPYKQCVGRAVTQRDKETPKHRIDRRIEKAAKLPLISEPWN